MNHPFFTVKTWNHPIEIETTNVVNVVCFWERRHLCISFTGLSLLAHRPHGTREDPVFQLHERLCCLDDTMRFRRVCNNVFISESQEYSRSTLFLHGIIVITADVLQRIVFAWHNISEQGDMWLEVSLYLCYPYKIDTIYI